MTESNVQGQIDLFILCWSMYRYNTIVPLLLES